jgi:hypothetical protein
MPELQKNAQRALVACSLWLNVGFIGTAALAAGLLQLFDGEATWLSALALAFSGGVLATASWRRGLSVLEHAEQASAVATDARSKPTSRGFSTQPGRGAIAMLSPIPLRSNPKRDDDLGRPTP